MDVSEFANFLARELLLEQVWAAQHWHNPYTSTHMRAYMIKDETDLQ